MGDLRLRFSKNATCAGAGAPGNRIYEQADQIGVTGRRWPKEWIIKKRVVFRIQLMPQAKSELLGISDRIGITQIALCSKIVE